jgi:Rad3-related DNA helicase
MIFAVCRGKISEGLDFSDDAARCVIIVGIPYPMTVDPKTILKKHYLDKTSTRDGISG